MAIDPEWENAGKARLKWLNGPHYGPNMLSF